MTQHPGKSPSRAGWALSVSSAWCLLLLGAASCASDWPGWRGPLRDGHVPPGIAVPQTLPREPRSIWRIKIGEGFASPVVAGSRVFHLDAQEGKETLHALDRSTGSELWRSPIDDV